MKIYVAAKWCDRELVRVLYRGLEVHGHSITLDWTDHEKDDTLDKVRWATDDINGVRECDLLVAVFTKPRHQRGAMIEVGAALGLNKPVIIVGTAESSSTLLKHPLVDNVPDIASLFHGILEGTIKWKC